MLSLDAGDPNTHNNLGNALAACGRSDEAIQEFQEAVRLKPASPAVLCNLAVVLAAKNRFADAGLYYRRALEIDPKFVGPAWSPDAC